MPRPFDQLRRFTFGQGELERDIDDEMALHVDLLSEELEERGLEPAEARREAESRFGDFQKHRGACRKSFHRRQRSRRFWLGWRELVDDLKFSLRGLRKSPGFALLATLTLALGVGANSAIFSVLHAVVLEPLPYKSPEHLVQIWETNDHLGLRRSNLSWANFSGLRQSSSSFEAMAAVAWARQTVTELGEPRRFLVARVSEDFFEVLGQAPWRGRNLRDEDFESGLACVVSFGLWNRLLGGDPEAVGRTLVLEGEPVTVVGVMPPGFDFPFDKSEIWRPLLVPPGQGRGHRYLDAFGRLAPGVETVAASAELNGLMQALAAEYPTSLEGAGMRVESLRDALVGEVRGLLVFLFAAVGLLLLIACVNVAHLTLSRATARRRELAIRASLGADRGRLLRQLLTESLVLAFFGTVAGLAVARWGLAIFTGLLPDAIPRSGEIRLDVDVLVFTGFLTLICGLLFGLVPGLRVTRTNLSDALRAGGNTLDMTTSGAHLRHGLVVAEVALAFVLVVGAGLLVRSFARVLEIDPGFRAENVVALPVVLPASSYSEEHQHAAFFERLIEQVRALPAVDSVGIVHRPPLRGGFSSSFVVVGRPAPPPNQDSLANLRIINSEYFRTLGIPLRRGRGIESADNSESPWVVVVNEAFARRHFAAEDPLGQSIDIGWRDGPRRVVGVVGDVKTNGLEVESPPVMYVPHTQDPFSSMMLMVRTSADPGVIAPQLRGCIHGLDSRLAVDTVLPLESQLARSMARRRFALLLLATFAGVALVLASIGIYGVLAQLVVSRRRELALRLALGANGGDVLRQVLSKGMVMASSGIVLGLAAALVVSRWVEVFLFEVSAADPLTFMVVAGVLAAVAFMACWLPARRVLRIEPSRVLQAD